MLSKKAGRYAILMKSLLLCAFLIPIIMPFPGQAQDAITSDGTMGTTVNFDSGNYGISNGTINGSNQFHSFGIFNVPTGESATFNGPPTIENIISRVTGGELSSIDGLLSSTIEGANLYLLNPAGILFGPNASLDLKGSFYASTADYLKFSDNFVFSADQTPYATLTVASPEAFGFLNGTPAGITFNGTVFPDGTTSSLEVPENSTFSVIGGNINIAATELLAPGGRISLASVASSGEVVPNGAGAAADLAVNSFSQYGTIDLSNYALIDAGGPGGGTVIIRGGNFYLDASSVYASTKADSTGTFGEGIDIQVTQEMVLDNGSQMATNVSQYVATDSWGVRIAADRLEVKNGGFIYSHVLPYGTGRSGDIEVTTNSLLVQDNAWIGTLSYGAWGNSGNIHITTIGDLEVLDRASIFSGSTQGIGNGGNIHVDADSILFSNEKYPGQYVTGIQSYSSQSYGNTGNIEVTTSSLQMLPGTEISTPTWWNGRSGDITVSVDGDATILGAPGLSTTISSNTKGGQWGGTGRGGDLEINVTGSLELRNHARIEANTASFGDGGNARINVGNLEIKDASGIQTAALNSWGGDAGNLEVVADNIFISGLESSTDPFRNDFTGLSSQGGRFAGSGGDLLITARESLTFTNRTSISSASLGPEPGGDIEIHAGSFQVLNGSSITAGAFGTGPGGNIVVEADSVLVSGVHPEPFVDITGVTNLAPSGIASQAGANGGSAGDVTITATNSIQLLDGGRLSADTFGDGDGGNVTAKADNVLISGVNADLLEFAIALGREPEAARSQIGSFSDASRTSVEATGNPGNIRIEASNLQLQDGGMITSEVETRGLGGTIELIADHATLSTDALVTARSINEGNSGSIIIGNVDNSSDLPDMQRLLVTNSTVTTSAQQALGGDIDMSAQRVELLYSGVRAESFGAADAGNIYIRAPAMYYMDHSSVSTEAVHADGGNIKIDADGMVHIVDSVISASVGGGPNTVGGNVSIDPEHVILVNSDIIAQAFEGRGGNILIIAGLYLKDEYSNVSASSAKGVQGTVDIRAPIKDVSQQVKPLQKRFTSASEMLRESCIARIRGGEYSSFVVGGRDGLPLEPGPRGLLPSPLPLQ